MNKSPKQIATTRWALVCILILTCIGGWLRFRDLDQRPMHTDEAVHGIKMLAARADGGFDYDPHEYHGPTLHYSALLLGGMTVRTDQAKLGEDAARLRWTPALYGTALIAAVGLGLLWIGAGWQTAILATALVALSPPLVYYSRYFIMEVPFVLFSWGFFLGSWQWWRRGGIGALVLAACSAGLLHATKETCILTFAAATLAAGLAALCGLRPMASAKNLLGGLGLMLLIAVIVSAAIYSGGFRLWSEIGESYTTYINYFTRAGGSGHEHAWWWYFSLLWPHRDGYWWGEPLTLVAGGLGLILCLLGGRRKSSPRGDDSSEESAGFFFYLACITGILFVLLSAIPYKTPWTMLVPYFGLLVLGGKAVASLGHISGIPSRASLWRPLLVGLLVCAGLWQFWIQDRRITYRMASDARNPWVYGHTSSNALRLVERLREIDQAISIIHPEHAWPLPWYLRDRQATGYWESVPETLSGEVFVCAPEELESLKLKLPGEWQEGMWGLRPDAVLISLTPKNGR